MASNTHEDGQIVESKENTPVSSPKNTYGSNKNDFAGSSSSRQSDLSKNEEQAKSSVQPNGENVKNIGVEAENLPAVNENNISVEAIVPENDNELIDSEGEVVCDTCGDLGYYTKLAICDKCGIGAEHTYCMAVKLDSVPDEWSCYDCIQDGDGIQEGKENEEANSREKKTESLIGSFEMVEGTSSQARHDLKTLRSYETIDLDLNMDPNLDLNLAPNLDLNLAPNLDLNLDPNLDMNLDLSLDCASSYGLRSSSNFQHHKRMRAPVNLSLGQQSFEEEGEEEQRAKRPRVEK